MNRPLASTTWIFLATVILVAVLIPFDPHLSEYARGLPEGVVSFNRRITDFGTFAWMIYGAGLLAIGAYIAQRVVRNDTALLKARAGLRLSLYFFLTIGTASALVHGLKFLIGRARPDMFADYGAYSLTPFTSEFLFNSFPSGHSTAAGAFFGAFAMLKPRFRVVFLLLALAIGVTRVIVGAHYPSDVAAGLLLGLWTALMMAFAFARNNWLFRLDSRGWPMPKNLVAPDTGQ